MNRVRSLLSMRGMLLEYSSEPMPNSCVLATAGLVMTISLSINRSLHSNKPVWRERTRLTSSEVWAPATSKVWRDSGRASFSSHQALLAGWAAITLGPKVYPDQLNRPKRVEKLHRLKKQPMFSEDSQTEWRELFDFLTEFPVFPSKTVSTPDFKWRG